LHELDGFEAGFTNPIAMADGYSFDGAKAYKDSKLCLMMLSNTLHAKYNKLTGIAFSSIYPGCIAESPLFREKRSWFRQYFPVFMKFITGGFVGERRSWSTPLPSCARPSLQQIRCLLELEWWST
jgi:protochlorophyllide reductase